MVYRSITALAAFARLAWVVVVVVFVALAAVVLLVGHLSRPALARICSSEARSDGRRDESGAISLVELVIVTVLASMLLVVIASVAAVAERSASLASSEYGASRRANAVLTSAMTAISDASPLYGCTLSNAGNQLSGAAVYSQQLSGCAQEKPQTSAVAAASSSGSAQGLCWYSYPGSGQGLVAPDLRCIVSYPDGEMWAFDWPPATGATYTTCPPTSCFGTSAPQPGSLPPEPTPSTGSYATFAGKTKPGSAPFVFTTSTGQPASSPSEIYGVGVNVVEDYKGGHAVNFSQSYSYQSYIGSAVQGSSGSWQTI